MAKGMTMSAGRTKLDVVDGSPREEEVVAAGVVLAPTVVVPPAVFGLGVDCPGVVKIVKVT
jgi:hypothetical protein